MLSEECVFDTNVLSELMGETPNESVYKRVMAVQLGYISIITVHEIQYGIALMDANGRNTEKLLLRSAAMFEHFSPRTLGITRETTQFAADFRAFARRNGRGLHLADALIAATAKEHNLQLATRNTRDFEFLEIDCFNPWEGA